MGKSWQKGPGNPASSHHAGRAQRRVLEDARENAASLLGAFPDEVVFTSGATEANNMALLGHTAATDCALIGSPIEHTSVLQVLRMLAKSGHPLSLVSPNTEGIVPVQELIGAIPAEATAGLVTLQMANQETGALQPVRELGERLAKSHPSLRLHTDATQAVGKIRVDFHHLLVHTLSLSAHKWGGPVGVGALLVRRGWPLRPLSHGGGQQDGRRPGTESSLLAAAFSVALTEAVADLNAFQNRALTLRQTIHNTLKQNAVAHEINGSPTGLPHILNLSFPGIRADLLLMALDLEQVAISAGSACSSGSILPSIVLTSMGLSRDRVQSSIRISLGHDTTLDIVDEAMIRLIRVVRRLGAVS